MTPHPSPTVAESPMSTSNYTGSSGPTPTPSSKASSPTPLATNSHPSLSSSQGHPSGSAATAAPPSDAPPDSVTRGSPSASEALLAWNLMNSRAKYRLLASLTEKAGRDPASIKTCFSTDLGFDYDADNSERRTLSGSPEQIAQDIHRYAEVGVEYFLFSYRSGSVTEVLESMEQFATEVRPLVA